MVSKGGDNARAQCRSAWLVSAAPPASPRHGQPPRARGAGLCCRQGTTRRCLRPASPRLLALAPGAAAVCSEPERGAGRQLCSASAGTVTLRCTAPDPSLVLLSLSHKLHASPHFQALTVVLPEVRLRSTQGPRLAQEMGRAARAKGWRRSLRSVCQAKGKQEGEGGDQSDAEKSFPALRGAFHKSVIRAVLLWGCCLVTPTH